MKTGELWSSHDLGAWNAALKKYWALVKPANLVIEQSLNTLDINRIRRFSESQWLEFLLEEYFRWKYTAPNRYITTTNQLKNYVAAGMLNDIDATRIALLGFPPENIKYGLVIATRIPGLGVAGASGLLSLMYPEHYATVDQFVVLALRRVNGLSRATAIAKMKPENLSIRDGVVLIDALAEKAAELNQLPGFRGWTPRKLDMVLWACRT